MNPLRLAALCALVILGAACGTSRTNASDRAVARPIAMRPIPASALALCREITLIRATCPRRVPIGPYAHARRPPGFKGPAAGGAIAICADNATRGVPLSSRACAYPSWILEVGAPAGVSPDAPPDVPGKRLPAAQRTRPPHYVHIIIYAARGSLADRFPFPWPRGAPRAVQDGLLRPDRTRPILLGPRHWAGVSGALLLAPPLVYGGENGDHLIFRWQQAGVDHAVSMHSWAPLREAVETLAAVIGSAR